MEQIDHGGEGVNIAVIDIGSPKQDNIGWAMVGNREGNGRNLDACISALAGALRAAPLALGFEAPMFVPMRGTPKELTSSPPLTGRPASAAEVA